jgi:hypothetical protein
MPTKRTFLRRRSKCLPTVARRVRHAMTKMKGERPPTAKSERLEFFVDSGAGPQIADMTRHLARILNAG